MGLLFNSLYGLFSEALATFIQGLLLLDVAVVVVLCLGLSKSSFSPKDPLLCNSLALHNFPFHHCITALYSFYFESVWNIYIRIYTYIYITKKSRNSIVQEPGNAFLVPTECSNHHLSQSP